MGMICCRVEHEMESMNWLVNWLNDYMRHGMHDNFMLGW